MTWCTTSRLPGRTSSALIHSILGEVGGDLDVLVLDEAFGWHPVVGNREDQIRFPNHPAVNEPRRRGQVLRVALGRAVVGPSKQRLAIGSRQASIVGELAVFRIGVPGRHVGVADFVADRLRMRPCVVIRQERHRADLPGAVTSDAVLVEDGRHVLAERRDRRSCPRRGVGVLRARLPALARCCTHGDDRVQSPHAASVIAHRERCEPRTGP